jgi:soluble lytic murein transglycosylase
MQSKAIMVLLLGASSVASSAQTGQIEAVPYPTPQVSGPAVSSGIAADIDRWNALRQTDSLPFSSYATFLLSHRGWPGEAGMRRAAEQRLSQEAAYPAEVIRFFTAFPPQSPGGHAALALALQASGRGQEAREEARRAWTGGAMTAAVEQRVLATFGTALAPVDHERRMEVLLANGDSQSAARTLMWAPIAKRPLYEARLALQNRASDASARLTALDSMSATRWRADPRSGDLAARHGPARGGAAVARIARTARSPARRCGALAR